MNFTPGLRLHFARALWPAAIALLSLALQAQTHWSRGRQGLVLGTDANALVLFGGRSGPDALLEDTWVRTAENGFWAKSRTEIAPSARAEHATVTIRGPGIFLLLFGGVTTRGLSDATWVYRGNEWSLHTQAPASAPLKRRGHALAYDPVRNRVVLFGGAGANALLNDTWEWDPAGQSWQEMLPATVPPARHGHAMAFDAVSGRVLLFGGYRFLADTWEWDGIDWRPIKPAQSPSGRRAHKMAADANGRIVLFGGLEAFRTWSDETWIWDGVNRTWLLQSPPTKPPQRGGHGMALDASSLGAEIVIAGGENELGLLRDSWAWDGNTWTERNPAPSDRGFAAAAYDDRNELVVMFGGSLDGSTMLDDTWVWDGLVWVERNPAVRPPPRHRHAMVFDERRGRVLLFGGSDGSRVLGDTWEWDGTSWAQHQVGSAPAPRCEPSMSWDPVNGRVVLFGGDDGAGTALGDTWVWGGSTWTSVSPAASPPARYGAGIATDEARKRIVLFGGFNGAASLADTWEWNGKTWLAVPAPAVPPARSNAAMVYDYARACIVLFGGLERSSGQGPSSQGDTWEWDGSGWQPVVLALSPDPRHASASAFDRRNRTVVLVGGSRSARPAARDTWLYASDNPAAFRVFGFGCPGSAGIPTLLRAQRPGNHPWLGTWFELEVRNLPSSAPAVVLVGGSITSCHGMALPISLGAHGAHGCTLETCNSLVLPVAGVAAFLPIPAIGALAGLTFYAQAIVLDPPANPLGITTSNRGDGTISAR